MADYFFEIFKKRYKPTFADAYTPLSRSKVLSEGGVLDALYKIPNDGSGLVADRTIFLTKKRRIKVIAVLGPGSGKLGTYLRVYYKRAIIYEVDKDPYVIKRLKKNFSGDSRRIPILSNAQDLPLKDDSVDLIVAYSVLRYIKKKDLVVDEILRVLKKGGYAVIAEARINKVIQKISTILKAQKVKHRQYTYRNQSFARVSFFYYLINESFYNKTLKRKIIEGMKIYNCNFVEAALRSAGSYTGSLFLVCLKKS